MRYLYEGPSSYVARDTQNQGHPSVAPVIRIGCDKDVCNTNQGTVSELNFENQRIKIRLGMLVVF